MREIGEGEYEEGSKARSTKGRRAGKQESNLDVVLVEVLHPALAIVHCCR